MNSLLDPGKQRPAVLYLLAVSALLATSIVIHLWRIGSAPPGLYVDESSNAYNAWCIGETGADEYGIRHPVFFRCLNDYHDPVIIYCLAPLVKSFGLQEWVVRLPSSVFLLLASVAFAFLVQEHCRNRWIALFGGFCFSLLPWCFPVSRTSSGGYTAMLFGMVTGWLLLLQAFRTPAVWRAVAAAAAWALSMYAYTIGRPMTVLLLGCFGLAFHRLIFKQWKTAFTFAASYLVLLLPMIVSVLHSPQSLTARFQVISIVRDHPSAAQLATRFAARYVEYFSPRFLFLAGDENLRHHTGHGGELFLFLSPLILTGAYWVIRNFRSEAAYRFIALGLLTYPVAAALTMEPMHSGRSINGVIVWLLLAMIGANALWQMGRTWRHVVVAVCVGIAIETALYVKDYFGQYQIRCRDAFQSPFTEALKYCFNHLGQGETLYVSESVGAPFGIVLTADFQPSLYAHILFYGKIDPRTYVHTGLPAELVRIYDRSTPKPGLLLRSDFRLVEPVTKERVQWEPNPEPLPTGARLLTTIHVKQLMNYQIYEVR